MKNSFEAAQAAVEAAADKKAYDLLILDLRGLTYLTDYFVIASGSNTTQVQAVMDGIQESLGRAGVRPSHIEGQTDSTWILMDYGDFVIHVFDEQTRMYYALEKLWADAPRVPLAASSRLKSAAP